MGLTIHDFCFLQKMTKVYLSYYPNGFGVCAATIIASFYCLLIISPQKIPATGKAVLIFDTAVPAALGGMVLFSNRLKVTQEESGVAPGAELLSRQPLFFSF